MRRLHGRRRRRNPVTFAVVAAVTAGSIALAAFAWALAGARPAPPTYFTPDDGVEHATTCARGTPAAKGAAALELVAYPWEQLGYRVDFAGPRRGLLAIAFVGEDRIEVYVRACQSVEAVASVLGHEFGHAVDDRYMSPAERGEYLAARGISGEWFGCNRCSDFATPAGDFAEVFGFLHSPPGRFRSRLAGPPDEAAGRALDHFFQPALAGVAP